MEAIASQIVSQLFAVVLLFFVVGLLLFIWVSGGTGIWAALQVMKESIDRWFNSWKQ